MRFEDTPEYKKGEIGQEIVNGMLLRSGWTLNKTYEQTGEGGAPKVYRMEEHGVLASIVLPDLDVWRCSGKKWERRWVEVKTKGKADWTIKTRTYDHGINRRHWNSYLDIQEGSGFQVYLFIYDMSKGNIIVRPISQLAPVARLYTGTKMGKDGMVFFPEREFYLWATTGAGEILQLLPESKKWIMK